MSELEKYEDKNLSTQSNNKSKIIQAFDNIGVDEEYIANNYRNIADNATKFISTKDDGIQAVPNYDTRLSALKDIGKMLGTFDKRNRKEEDIPEGLIYVFSKAKKE